MSTTRLHLNGVMGKPWSFSAKTEAPVIGDAYMVATIQVRSAIDATTTIRNAVAGTPDIKPD